jgi:thiol:disulfide interchange protein DsbC
MKKILLAGAFLSASFGLLAAEENTTKTVEAEDSVISKALAKLGVETFNVNNSEIAGLKEALTSAGVIYISNDGKHLIQGDILSIANPNEIVNVTKPKLAKLRKLGLEKFEDSMLVYKAPDEKYRITVFTDISCGYCRKLHGEMEELLDLGVTVRYLGYPRSGLRSQAYVDLMNVWCAEDQQEAMTNAKSGARTPMASDCTAPIDEHYRFGQSVGVSGTPAIVLDDGSLIPGYKPAKDLVAILEANKAAQ